MDKTTKILRREVFTPGNSLQVREAGGNSEAPRIIEGYAILFNTPSDPLWDDDESVAREVIAPDAVTQALLDTSDIKLTMFHNRELILARSNKGKGTLKYEIDDKGVKFSCEVPDTVDGDKAYNLISRGDIAGCSFMFTVLYKDPASVTREEVVLQDGRRGITFTIRAIEAIYDFTLAADPAYPQTEVNARERIKEDAARVESRPTELTECAREQIRSLRTLATAKSINY